MTVLSHHDTRKLVLRQSVPPHDSDLKSSLTLVNEYKGLLDATGRVVIHEVYVMK